MLKKKRQSKNFILGASKVCALFFMKKACIIPSKGIGDAFLMMIGAYHLKKENYQVTIYHDKTDGFTDVFKNYDFFSFFDLPSIEELENKFDLILLQNDNSSFCKSLIKYKRKHNKKNIIVFYPTYKRSKHGTLSINDFVFNDQATVADNISNSLSIFSKKSVKKELDLFLEKDLIFKKNNTRVLIHPTSGDEEKNYSKKKYLKLYHKLKKASFDVSFILSEKEKIFFSNENVIWINSFKELVKTIYESSFLIGNDSLLGHVASYLNIPTITITKDRENIKLWRPGFLYGDVISPNRFIPKKLLKKNYSFFISPNRVLKTFLNTFN
jgi:heptosyltransferase III